MSNLAYSLTDLCSVVGGKLLRGDGSSEIQRVFIDSRKVGGGASSLFIALRGVHHDGHNYCQEAYRAGVRNFLLEDNKPANLPQDDVNIILVKNSLAALQSIAAFHRGRFTYPVLAVTGSNGKTTVKEWLFTLLDPEYTIVRNPKSYNSQVGVPLSVLGMGETHELAIFEAGISMTGEMQNLQKILNPTAGIFITIGPAHQEHFESILQKAKEKAFLFKDCETVIYCKDYAEIDQALKESVKPSCRLISWSRKEPADLQNVTVQKSQGSATITAQRSGESISITIPMQDDASIENAVMCWLYMLTAGYSNPVIAGRMERLQAVAMRLEILDGVDGVTLINDSYNSDIGSLAIALDLMSQQKQHSRKTAVISDILQSREEEQQLYEEVARLLVQKGVDRLIGVGKAISVHAALFPMEKKFYDSTDQLLTDVKPGFFRDEVVLLKGNRQFKFERISNRLQHKAHETVLNIDLSALVHNLNCYRSKLKPETKVMVMTKAFGYGSGGVEVANVLEFNRVDYLAVAYADEGIALRRSGISTPILVMNPQPGSYDGMIRHRLEPEIFSLATLNGFAAALQQSDSDSFPVHIKLDTGMHRLGFLETDELVSRLKQLPELHIASVFTHLAASEDPRHDGFSREQLSRFDKMYAAISLALGYNPTRHVLNSSGVTRFKDAHYDMVRLGIGVYGISSEPAVQEQLQNVATLNTMVSQVKTVRAGESVGYSRAFIAEKDMTIAVLPIGYADGLDRRYGNGCGSVLIGEKRAPVIGHVCMDMCMIDTTGIVVEEGDVVQIFGPGLAICEVAQRMGTITYEVLTRVSTRVKRVYYH